MQLGGAGCAWVGVLHRTSQLAIVCSVALGLGLATKHDGCLRNLEAPEWVMCGGRYNGQLSGQLGWQLIGQLRWHLTEQLRWQLFGQLSEEQSGQPRERLSGQLGGPLSVTLVTLEGN